MYFCIAFNDGQPIRVAVLEESSLAAWMPAGWSLAVDDVSFIGNAGGAGTAAG